MLKVEKPTEFDILGDPDAGAFAGSSDNGGVAGFGFAAGLMKKQMELGMQEDDNQAYSQFENKSNQDGTTNDKS